VGTCSVDVNAAYAWRSGGAAWSVHRDERVSGALKARPRYGAITLWEDSSSGGRVVYYVPEYVPKGIDSLVWIVGGESRNLATYRQDEGTGGPADQLEGRHWVPEAICQDAWVADERVDELTDETREYGQEALIRELEKGHR